MSTLELNATTTSIGVGSLLLGMLFIGTGGASTVANPNVERSGFSNPAIISNSIVLNSVNVDKSNGKALDFQKLSLELMNTFGFSVKQYSEIMQVTRATIYKWHDLNAPLKKVQSRSLDRLKKLNEALVGLKDSRKAYFSDWLRSPLNKDSVRIYEMLIAKNIDVGSFIEMLPMINFGLHAYESSNDLDDLLGLS